MGVSEEIEESGLILLYKGLKGATSIPTDDLFTALCTFFRQKLTTALLESAKGRE